ncbi:MAG: hypothetical protein ACYS0E_03865 [Planctomycetota bacterium]|jgi:hypothetical protein
MIAVRRILPILLLACACASTEKSDEPLLTEEQQAELDRIVGKRMSAVSGTVSLSDSQRESIRPIMEKAKKEFIVASRAYRADPTPKNMEKFQAKMRQLGLGLRKDLQPFMTSGQRNQYLVVVDQVIQDVRAARARGE